MDPSALLLELLAPLRVGDEVLPGVVLDGVSTELGTRFCFRADGERVWVDVSQVAETLRFASRSAEFAFGYRTEGGKRSVDPALGTTLCAALSARASTNEARVLELLRDRAHTADDEAEARVREVTVSRLLEPAGGATERFYTLSPYVGCLIGCRFCYAQSKVGALRRLLGRRETAWGSYVDVRANAPDVLARELASTERELLPVKFCPVVSDPYQAIERRERVTRRCLEALASAERAFPVLLLTRSALILEDIERIAALSSAWVGVSLPTADDEVRRHFEPRAATVTERLEVLRAFRKRGVRTLAVVQPILPGAPDAHADALAECADSVSIDVLRGVEAAGPDFDDARYAVSATDAWQLERALALRDELSRRGVPVWRGELPPELSGSEGFSPEA